MLLLLTPVAEDGLLSEAIDPDDCPGHHRGAAELLDDQHVADVSGAPAPIIGGVGQPEISHPAHLPRQLEGEFAFAIDLHRHGPYRPLGKIPCHVLDHFLLLTQIEIHFLPFSPFMEVGLH